MWPDLLIIRAVYFNVKQFKKLQVSQEWCCGKSSGLCFRELDGEFQLHRLVLNPLTSLHLHFFFKLKASEYIISKVHPSYEIVCLLVLLSSLPPPHARWMKPLELAE